ADRGGGVWADQRSKNEELLVRLLSIVGLQMEPVAGDPDATLTRFENRVRVVRATFTGAHMVLAPELHLAGVGSLFAEQPGHAGRVAVEIPGPVTDRLGALARETGLWLVPGSLYERDGDAIHNTAIVLSPGGELVT